MNIFTHSVGTFLVHPGLYSISSYSLASSMDGIHTRREADADRDSSFGLKSWVLATSDQHNPVYNTCLRPYLAYKTIMITAQTTSREVITSLLTRFRIRHQNHKL